jgi:predicted DNA-binding transcriptional regulator YafY
MVSAVLFQVQVMRRADRLLRIIQILRRHRRPVIGRVVADELEISLRTLYRDIADLVTDGVPIRGEAGVGYVLGEGYDLPPLMFTADELEALMLGLRWVQRRGDKALIQAATDTVAKIGTVLPADLKPLLFDASLIVSPFKEIFSDTVDVAMIRKAIREQRKLRVVYKDEKSRETHRIIWPIGISYFDSQRLVFGWCELRSGFRAFRTDRIINAETISEKYKEKRIVLLKRWMKEMNIASGN